MKLSNRHPLPRISSYVAAFPGRSATCYFRGVSAAGYVPQLRGAIPDQPYELEVMGQTIQIDSPFLLL